MHTYRKVFSVLPEMDVKNESQYEEYMDKFARLLREQSLHRTIGLALLREKSAEWIQQRFDLLDVTIEETYEDAVTKLALLLFPASRLYIELHRSIILPPI